MLMNASTYEWLYNELRSGDDVHRIAVENPECVAVTVPIVAPCCSVAPVCTLCCSLGTIRVSCCLCRLQYDTLMSVFAQKYQRMTMKVQSASAAEGVAFRLRSRSFPRLVR